MLWSANHCAPLRRRRCRWDSFMLGGRVVRDPDGVIDWGLIPALSKDQYEEPMQRLDVEVVVSGRGRSVSPELPAGADPTAPTPEAHP